MIGKNHNDSVSLNALFPGGANEDSLNDIASMLKVVYPEVRMDQKCQARLTQFLGDGKSILGSPLMRKGLFQINLWADSATTRDSRRNDLFIFPKSLPIPRSPDET